MYRLWKAGKDIQPHPEDPPEKREAIEQGKTDLEAYAEKRKEEKVKREERLRKLTEEQGYRGYASELSSSDFDSDDLEDNDTSDQDIGDAEKGDNSDDSDYHCSTKIGPKRKKMMTRKQSWKQERISSEGKNSQLGENISKMVQFMRKKQKSNKTGQNVIFDPSEVKEEVKSKKKEAKDISIEAAMPILLGLGIIKRANDDDEDNDEDATFYWMGLKHEGTKEKFMSILSEEEGKDDDEKAWILCKKALRIVLRLPAGQAIATQEIFSQIGGDYEAGESREKADDYSKMSAALRVLQVCVCDYVNISEIIP